MLAPPLETASPESPLPPMPSPPMAPAPPVESLAPIEPPPAIEPPVVEPPPTAASARAAANEEPYQIVTVFYGTDRAVVEPLQANQPAYSHWFSLTAACAGLTMLLSALMFRFAQSRTLKALTGLGAAATVVLGLVTTQANWPANPAEPQPGRVYGSGRGSLEMGTCQVSIPRRHEVGKLESPSVFRFEFHADPARHVVLLDARQEPADAFYAGLRTRVAKSRRKEALVFVHGYNVTFETAARRTAQLAYDLQFDGAAIFFSWPSQGTLLGYPVDETNAAWTAPHLKQFLLEVAERSGAESVHLIAHSMGNRALTAALQSIAYERKDRLPMFREVVLTAPDIDADMFQRDIAPAIVGTADRVTLYASSNDEALILSKQFHGYARAGDSGPGLVVVPGVDTIDVSTVDTSLTGHFYYGSNGTVLADLVELLGEAKPPPARRFLQPMSLGHLTYWVFQTNRSTASALALPPSGRL